MKEFKQALKLVLIFQILCWGIFTLCDENPLTTQSTAENIALSFALLSQIGLLIFYYIHINKQIKKNNLNSLKFNIFLFILWIASSISMIYIFLYLVEKNYLHVCQGIGLS